MKKLTFFGVLVTFVLLVSFTSVSAKEDVIQKFEVKQRDKSVATVFLKQGEVSKTLFIRRKGQPTHVYQSFPSVSAFSLHIGKERVLTYYSELRQIRTKDISFSLADANQSIANYGREDISTLRQLVADDMVILRTVREISPSIRFFETALVIATGDETVLKGEAPASFQVSEASIEVTASKAKFVRTGTKKQISPIEACVQRCRNTETRCVPDVPPSDRIRCYEASFRCQENCERTNGTGIGPAQPETQP